jgi:hypothetical protein
MAQLTAAQLTECRNLLERSSAPVPTATKAQVNSAIQAIEDWFEASRPSLSAAINAATTPLVLTGAQKGRLLKYFLAQKAGRE